MPLDKLRVAARQHEQREDWRAAIELYRQAIREGEGTPEGSDPALYNRIGDLAHKAGDEAAACEAWEQAAVRYGEQGFFNNAIALCTKILRLDPARLQVLLQLARFQARKRVLYDVQHNLKTYLDRMTASGRRDAARSALQHFGDEFPGWHDLDLLLDDLLGRERLAESSRGEVTAGRGPARDLVYIDTGPLEIERASEPATDAVADHGVVGDLEFEPRPEAGALPGLVPTVPDGDTGTGMTAVAEVEGLVDAERTTHEMRVPQPVEGLETGEVAAIDPGVESLPLEGFEQTAQSAPPAERSDIDRVGDDEPMAGGALVYLDATPTTTLPEAAPDDPLGQRVLAQALLEQGDRVAGVAALERALALYQERDEWLHATQVAGELIQAEPAVIARYQARVEIAARMRDPVRLCEAYVELGDALVREGSGEKAIAVYRRVLELDDHNPRAREALNAMAPRAVASVDDGFVDFAAMVVDDAGPRSTRMRTETPDIDPDEDETFRDALAEFKRALDQNLPIEDHQAHYDLGIAFKEMGLLDEAIGEFQKALRAPEVRLRTSESLGEVFFDQGRPAVAEAVLRGVERGPEGDAEKIGVLYWLGRALEAQGKGHDALQYFQRVLAVDVTFRDVTERVVRLSAEPGA